MFVENVAEDKNFKGECRMQGWLFGINVKIDASLFENEKGCLEEFGSGYLYTNLLHKFHKDCVKKNGKIFLEGVITNKAELMELEEQMTWEEIIEKSVGQSEFPGKLRGSFCGYYFDAQENVVFFTDHVAGKSLFYYSSEDQIIASTRLEWLVKTLKYNKLNYTIDENAIKYMLTYGFMLDDSTYVTQIKKILPGHKLVYKKGKTKEIRYHSFVMQSLQNVSEEEAMKMIDDAFRMAVKREFEKDREYGYKHLVDLSGGLDSRMVSWVAHEMGYQNQTNIAYCKAEYLDYKISSQIAKDLKHEYYFKQLDDIQWLYEIEEILKLNNGMALFSGVTGGKQFLELLNPELYGVEHTGMLGDVILSTYAQSVEEALQKPKFGLRQYSTKLKFEYNSQLLDKYESQEMFDIYTRGFLGILATYGIRQNYLEVGSPFLDVDFIDVCFSIPLKYRVNHNIYIKWMNKYYEESAKYGWEKWHGIPPKMENLFWKKAAGVFREGKRHLRYMLGYKLNDSMNPFEYWYEKDDEMRRFINGYYDAHISKCVVSKELKENIEKMFKQGTSLEKCQVLTVIGMVKMCLEENKWN